MNWDAVGAIGEIIGALGVIVTVGYLAVQVRHNTRALHNASYQHDADQMNRLNIAVVENPQFAQLLARALENPEGLEPGEWAQFNAFMLANFHVFETLYQGYLNGTIPPELFKAEERGIRTLIKQPATAIWWEQIMELGPFTDEFRAHIESLRGQPGGGDWAAALNWSKRQIE